MRACVCVCASISERVLVLMAGLQTLEFSLASDHLIRSPISYRTQSKPNLTSVTLDSPKYFPTIRHSGPEINQRESPITFTVAAPHIIATNIYPGMGLLSVQALFRGFPCPVLPQPPTVMALSSSDVQQVKSNNQCSFQDVHTGCFQP